MPEQIALKFPDGTRARLKSLAVNGETMTATLRRALDRLSEPTASRDESSLIVDLIARVDALERRMVGSNLNRETAIQAASGDGRRYSAPERCWTSKGAPRSRSAAPCSRNLAAPRPPAPSVVSSTPGRPI